jgi:hypothetical protein
MSAAVPFRISARAAIARGGRALWRAPGPTLLAVAGTVTAALAARAAWVRAGQALFAERPGRAALIWLVGASVAALLVDVTRAAALTAYAGPPRPLAQTLALGLLRTPGMISVRAVELLIYFALGLGDLFVLARALVRVGDDPTRQALVTALLLLPSLALMLGIFAASRVAQTVIARGLLPAPALAHGYDVALRRFPSLARLALFGTISTAPLVVAAVWMPFPLGVALVGVAALWLYAALATLVGSDARLSMG